jgi:hypothetical protein
MIHMVISEARHGEVAVVIIGLKPDVDARVDASFLSCVGEIFRQKLSLLVEIVSSPLRLVSGYDMLNIAAELTYDIDQYIQRPTFPPLDQLR